MVDLLRIAAGLALFLFPGLAWTLALAPRMPWYKALAVGMVMAFTMAPLALMVLNVFFGVPIRLSTVAFLAAGLGMSGLVVRLGPGLLARVAA